MAAPVSKKSTTVRSGWFPQYRALRAAFRTLDPLAPGLAAAWAARIWCTPPRARRPRPVRTPPGTGFTVTLPGRREVMAEAWGEGPVAYLLHGWGGWRGQLTGLVPPLLAAGHRVVALDAPGHGDSGPGRLRGRRTTLPEIAEALAAVVAVTGPARAVIAHSGGANATALAVQDGLPVDRLVFLAPMANPVPYVEPFARALGLGASTVPRLLDTMARLVDRPLTDLDVPARAAGAEALPPLLVVHDRRDREVRYADGQAIAESWPEAVLHTTDGLGHRRIVTDPAVVEAAVRFVAAGRLTPAAAGPPPP